MIKFNKKYLLSIIIANYNNERFLGECIDSILCQTYKNIEIIISDDFSNDNSFEIIKHYEKKHPEIVKSIQFFENRGVARCRHDGILRSKGQYITTLDSDDYFYDSRKLEREMEIIRFYKENENKDVLSFSNIVWVTGDRKIIGERGTPENIKQGGILEEIMTRSCLIPRDFVMLKSLYFNVKGYDSSFPIYEDWDLKLRLSAKYEFYYTGINGTAYRRHGEGLSSVQLPEHVKVLKKIFYKNLNLVNRSKSIEIEKKFNQYIKTIEKSWTKTNSEN